MVVGPDALDRGPEVPSGDFPGGSTRWIRNSVGVDTVVVNGEVTWTDADGYAPKARAGIIATAFVWPGVVALRPDVRTKHSDQRFSRPGSSFPGSSGQRCLG